MKKLLMLTFTLVSLTLSSFSFAATLFVPKANIINKSTTTIQLQENGFGNAVMSYSADFPEAVSSGTSLKYGLEANSDGMSQPSVGDMQRLSYIGVLGGSLCTFEFTYQGDNKFSVQGIPQDQCSVTENGDLIIGSTPTK